jgi:hypothetical protein
MQADEFRTLMRADPFVPLRILLNDGTTYEVMQPYMAMAMKAYLVVGIPDPESNGQWAHDTVEIDWPRIANVDRFVPEGAVA